MGIGKRITLTGSNRISKGIRIINVDKGDELISVTVLDNTINKILIMTHDGFCLKFDINKVRNMGRNARGCILIRFKDKNDYVISSLGIHDEEKIPGSDDSVGIIPGDNIFTVSELGYGKILNVNEIRAVANKGGKGVKINNDKAGKLVKAIKINDNETIFISTKMGGLIRVKADSIPTRRRNGLGVKLIKLENGDKITLASSAPDYKEDDE
jgi:DNA gyrase subunit A